MGLLCRCPAPAYHRLSGVQKHVQKQSMCLEEKSFSVYLTVSKTLEKYKVGLVLQSVQDLSC